MRVVFIPTMVQVHITKLSSNAKTGKIPVTTSEESTCPTTCPFYGGSCYAKSGFHLRTHWQKVSNKERGTDWQGLTDFVKALKPKQLWRHNQAGDMPHFQGHIRLDLLKDLVQANQESQARGYTYTHHKLITHNVEAMKFANNNGFTINASTESLEDADKAIKKGLPAVCVVDNSKETPTKTPDGHKVVVCPAQVRDGVTCKDCGLCQQAKRKCVVAFLAHGNKAKEINKTLAQ
tara:strand:+ start:372 stop:1073 length:702 start_codon:yes stop_codon:yes gene_type:complete